MQLQFTEDELSDFSPEISARLRRAQEKRAAGHKTRAQLGEAALAQARTRDRHRECLVALRGHLGTLAVHPSRLQNVALPWMAPQLERGLRSEWEGLSKRLARIRSDAGAGCALSTAFLADYQEVIAQAEEAADAREREDAAARARSTEHAQRAEAARVEAEDARLAIEAAKSPEDKAAEREADRLQTQKLLKSRRKGPVPLRLKVSPPSAPYDWENDPEALLAYTLRPHA